MTYLITLSLEKVLNFGFQNLYEPCAKKTAGKFWNATLTTALLSGGWVPVIPRSIHYWQPAPRWRLLPWLRESLSPNKHAQIQWHPTKFHKGVDKRHTC